MSLLVESILAKEGVVLKEINYGGITKEELFTRLINEKIYLNEYAKVLITSDIFVTSFQKRIANIVELSIHDLGFENGATFTEIIQKIQKYGFMLCPLEIGPYLRLSYMDQKEEIESGKNKAPKGSITIFSKIEKEQEEEFPKGFYIRKMDGKLWLRGYVCPMDYLWEPQARITLQM